MSITLVAIETWLKQVEVTDKFKVNHKCKVTGMFFLSNWLGL